MRDLKTMTLEELAGWVRELGEPGYRARQIWRWLYQKQAGSFEEMTDLRKDLRERLAREARIGGLRLARRVTSKDKETTKFLFVLPDGEAVESVLMRYRGDERGGDRLSACLSTQVGCALACRFCASGVDGMKRNLLAWEIIDQFLQIQRHQPRPLTSGQRCPGRRPPERIGNVVFMGMGEPLANYDATLAAVRFLHRPDTFGIGMRHMTISTSGLADKIRKLAEEKLPIHLAISLHAPNDVLRSKLMPINRRFPISALLDACRHYYRTTRRRLTFEYILMDGVNDAPELARELARVLDGLYSLVNLIPMNLVKEFPYRPSPAARIRAFQAILEEAGIKTTVRAEKGDDLDAACGQLRRRSAKEIETPPRRLVPP